MTAPTGLEVKSVKGSKISAKWKKNSKASGYQIKYVNGSKTKTKTYSGKNAVSKTISDLKKGKTYKVYVRTYKQVSGTKYYSAWSSAKSVKIKK